MEELFFCGTKQHALDSQCRVSLPAEWRQPEGETRLILFPGEDSSYLLFPFEVFQDFMKNARRASFSNPAAQRALARLGARTRDCRTDEPGRIKLDRPMLDRIGVENQLCMVGAWTHIRICSPETWEKIENGEAEENNFDMLQSMSGGSSELMRFMQEKLGL